MEEKSPASSYPDKLPEGKVVLGYCHRPSVPHEFVECLLNLQASRIGINKIIHERTFFIASGRNLVVKQFLEDKNAEWLLFVDDDIYFTPQDILRLYSLADKDRVPIIGGLYFGRLGAEGGYGNTILPVWLKIAKDGLFQSVSTLSGADTQEVDVLGMGFTLIHRGVLEKLYDKYKEGNVVDNWIWFGHDIRAGKRIGEDATFCLRAKELGYKVHGTTQVVLNHLKDHVYSLQMFMNQPGIFAPK